MRHSFFRIGIIFALLITMGVRQIWAYNPHFYLTGEKPTGGWSNNATAWFLVSPASDTYDQYCTYVWLSENDYFGLNNGTKRYSRCDNIDQDIKDGYGSGQFGYPDGNTQKDKAFKYIGATGLVRINVSEADGHCGATDCGEYYPWVWVNEGLEIGILKGEKVMFYFGSNTAKVLNPDWLYLSTTSKAPHTASERYHRLNEQKCSSYISVAYVDAGVRYYISDYDPWGGVQMGENAIAGSLYSIYKDNNGVDQIYRNKGSVPHFSTTTVNKTVGTRVSEIAATAANSIYGNEQVLYYYYTTDGGNSFTKFDPSDIRSLAVGVYTVYALGWDGHILVRSDNTVTLNVGVTISLDANGGTDGNVTSVFATSGIAASTENIAAASLPTKTGYTFNGFWTSGGIEVINKNGEWKTNVSGYTDNSGKWICSAASTLYAKWTARHYTVTLEGMEADGGPIDVDVKYDAVLQPLENKHTKAHYDLLGYWAADDNQGIKKTKKLINEKGNWIPDVEGYTGKDGEGRPTWRYADRNISLFADWEEIKYTVKVDVSPAGAGVVQVNGANIKEVTNVGFATKSDEMTPVANAGWVFKEWQVSSGNLQMDLKNYHSNYQKEGTNAMKVNATADGQKLTAVFEPRYYLVGGEIIVWGDGGPGTESGMPGWANYNKPFEIVTNSPILATCSLTLDSNKDFYILVRDKADGLSYGKSGGISLGDDASITFTDQDNKVFFYSNGGTNYTFKITAVDGSGRPTVSVERPHQMHFAHKRVDIDGNDHIDDLGGTLTATINGEPAIDEQWFNYGSDVKWTATAQTGYSLTWYIDKAYSNAMDPQPPTSWNNPNITHDENIFVKFVEKATAVTLSNDGHGKIQIDGVDKTETTVGVTTHRKLTAVPDEGYKLNSWTIVSGDNIALSSTSTNPTTLSGLGAGAVSGQEVRANFVERWVLKPESEGWGHEEFSIANVSIVAENAIGYVDIALPANTNLQFKMVDKQTGVDYKPVSNQFSYMTNGNSYKWSFDTDKAHNCGITTAGAGTYRFIWNITDKTMSVIYPNFVIYRTGDKDEDSESATHTTTTPVESYNGGPIEQAIEFRMKVRELDKWYSLCLPFKVNKVCVWDNKDGAYYDIVPYYRPTPGGPFYTGHYIIRTPDGSTTNFAIEGFEGRDRWTDPESPDVLPYKDIPYIIQWHDQYFRDKYISFFGDTNQDIPSNFDAGERPSANDVVNIFGNNTMHSGTVEDAYLLDKDYGPSGAWLREDIGRDRTILPFECFIRANDATTTRYRILRRGMEETDTPTALEQISNHQSPMTIRVYTITGVLIGEYNDCSFQDAAHRIATDYNEGIYILRSENESMKLLLGGK